MARKIEKITGWTEPIECDLRECLRASKSKYVKIIELGSYNEQDKVFRNSIIQRAIVEQIEIPIY